MSHFVLVTKNPTNEAIKVFFGDCFGVQIFFLSLVYSGKFSAFTVAGPRVTKFFQLSGKII